MSSFLLFKILCYNKNGGKMKKNKRKKRTKKLFVAIFLLMVLSIASYYIYIRYNNVRKIRLLFKQLEGSVEINEYTIYGNHFNISGFLTSNSKFDNITLVLKNSKIEKEYQLIYQYDDNRFNFQLSSNINSGIDLEKIKEDTYYLFIKAYIDDQIYYYALENKTDYKDLEYYTMTKNNQINRIKLHVDEFKLSEKTTIEYFKLTCKKQHINNDVYDIVIDPGHGGKDSGAISLNKKYTEANITLDISKKLKKELEDIGLRVKLTRDNDETLNSYGNNGRAVIANQYKAKLLLSIHLNSSEYKITKGGLEIYVPNDFELSLARLMASNIVGSANTNYSVNQTDQIEPGIYRRTFSKADIVDAKQQANEIGYEPYNITTSTPSLYMLRETGGIMTHAYIDGRNPNYDKNPYYNSNIAVEAYLLELGFINNDVDLNNIFNNSDLYVKAIVKSIQEHYDLN